MSSVSIEIKSEPEIRQAQPAVKPARGLTQKAYLNAFSSFLDYGVKVVVLSVVTPILVAGLGNSLYGVWQMLGRMITYMQAADGRPTQALKWLIANQQALDNPDEKRRHIGSALGVWLMFLPVILVLSIVLVWLAPIITKVPAELRGVVRFTCALLVVNFLLTNLIALPESVLRGMNLGYKRMGLQAGLSVVGGVLTVGALYTGAGLIGLAWAQIVLAALTGVLFWFVVKRYVPWFGITRPRMAEVRSFLKLSIWWFAWTLINKLLMASDILVLGIVASAEAVTTYSLTGYAAITLLSIVTMVLGAATPGLGGVIGTKQYDKALKLRREMMTMSWLLLTCIGSTILLWNRSFIYLWVGAEHYAGYWANLLTVIMIVQFAFIRNDTYVIDLTLELRGKVCMGAVAALLSIALSALLIPSFGIAGLCLGMIAGRLVLTVAYPFIVNSHLGNDHRLSLRKRVRPVLTMCLMFAASSYFGQELLAGNWLEWLLSIFVSFGLALCVAMFVGLRAELREPVTRRLMMLRTFYAAR
jgi:O-antigen/teichoic acid export membrane protein